MSSPGLYCITGIGLIQGKQDIHPELPGCIFGKLCPKMRHKCFGFAELIPEFSCGAGDEVGGHVRLLDSISFLFYFFVWDGKGEGMANSGAERPGRADADRTTDTH